MAELINREPIVKKVKSFAEYEWNNSRKQAYMEFLDMLTDAPTVEADIRNKAIDEFAEKMKKIGIQNNYHCSDCACEFCDGKCEPCERGFEKEIDEIAEQLKGE